MGAPTFWKMFGFFVVLSFCAAESAEARYRKSGFVKIGLGVTRQLFDSKLDSNNAILNPDFTDSRGVTHFIDGYQGFAEFYLTKAVSFGARYSLLERSFDSLNNAESQTAKLSVASFEVNYGFEVVKKTASFADAALEFGFGLGYGVANWEIETVAPDSTDAIPGSALQVIFYLDYGGFGPGLRLKLLYHDFSWEEDNGFITSETLQTDFDQLAVALDFRISFLDRSPIFQ